MKDRCWPLLMLLCSIGHSAAHPALEHRLEAANTQVLKRADAHAHIRLANLHAEQRNWPQAHKNLHQAEQLGHNIQYHRASLFYQQSKEQPSNKQLLDQANKAIRLFIKQHPNDANAALLYARIQVLLGKHITAVAGYLKALSLSNSAKKELYLEIAEYQRNQRSPSAALKTLKQGINQFGPLLSLISLAIEISKQQSDYDTALRWHALLPTKLAHQPQYLLQKGDLLMLSGQTNAACQAWQAARLSLASLPAVKRHYPIFKRTGKALAEKPHC